MFSSCLHLVGKRAHRLFKISYWSTDLILDLEQDFPLNFLPIHEAVKLFSACFTKETKRAVFSWISILSASAWSSSIWETADCVRTRPCRWCHKCRSETWNSWLKPGHLALLLAGDPWSFWENPQDIHVIIIHTWICLKLEYFPSSAGLMGNTTILNHQWILVYPTDYRQTHILLWDFSSTITWQIMISRRWLQTNYALFRLTYSTLDAFCNFCSPGQCLMVHESSKLG